MDQLSEIRQNYSDQYSSENSAVFYTTRAKWGGFSNFATGYPMQINGIVIPTVEHLYQACRFPHLPGIQRDIITAKTPKDAKAVAKLNIQDTRADWEDVKIQIMYWCLQVKLYQNFDRFSKLLSETRSLNIVERSKTDNFWGAIRCGNGTYRGCNVLGQLLVKLRNNVDPRSRVRVWPTQTLYLYGHPITEVYPRS